MSFNPDPNKPATEVLISCKVNSENHLHLTLNGNQVQQCSSQKHLGLFSDNWLNLILTNILTRKCNKTIGIMKKLSTSVSRQSLLTIYK